MTRPITHLGASLLALASTVATAIALTAGTAPASTSHAGWPPDEHLVMDKGPAGRHHVLRGLPSRHNWLLGGYGDDELVGGQAGDVIWGDYHPSGWPAAPDGGHPRGQRQELHLLQRHGQLRLHRQQPGDRRARPRGLGRDPLRKPAHRRLHEPPRAAALQAARLPPHQLLLGRLLRRVRLEQSARAAPRRPPRRALRPRASPRRSSEASVVSITCPAVVPRSARNASSSGAWSGSPSAAHSPRWRSRAQFVVGSDHLRRDPDERERDHRELRPSGRVRRRSGTPRRPARPERSPSPRPRRARAFASGARGSRSACRTRASPRSTARSRGPRRRRARLRRSRPPRAAARGPALPRARARCAGR